MSEQTKEKCFLQMCIWVANIHRWSTSLCWLWNEWVNFKEKKFESECKVDKKRSFQRQSQWHKTEKRRKNQWKGKKTERFECNSIEREIFSIVQSLKLKLFLSAIITKENFPSLNKVSFSRTVVKARGKLKLKIVCSPLPVYSLSKFFLLVF